MISPISVTRPVNMRTALKVARASQSGHQPARLQKVDDQTIESGRVFDTAGMAGAGQKTASLVPGAVHKVLPGTGHACCIEDPAGFDGLVIEFLRARGLMPAL